MSDTCGGQYIPCYNVLQQYFLNDLGLHHFFISFVLICQNSVMYYITTKLTYLLTCHIGGGMLQTRSDIFESLRGMKVLKLCRLKSEDLSQNLYRAACFICFLPSDLIQG